MFNSLVFSFLYESLFMILKAQITIFFIQIDDFYKEFGAQIK